MLRVNLSSQTENGIQILTRIQPTLSENVTQQFRFGRQLWSIVVNFIQTLYAHFCGIQEIYAILGRKVELLTRILKCVLFPECHRPCHMVTIMNERIT
jgi:hypothetical protein